MKKRVIFMLCFLMLSGSVYAFEMTKIMPDDSILQGIGRDTAVDRVYLRTVAMRYSDRFVVSEVTDADISAIDEFYAKLSSPITLDEIDNGKSELDINRIGGNEYQKNMRTFKTLGGLSGYRAEFEPIAYYTIYRNITLVGGYVNYTKTCQNPDDAYWQYICGMEDLTKEVIPYETRLRLLDKVRELNSFMDNDRSFKIYILKDGKVDSMWEGVDAVG